MTIEYENTLEDIINFNLYHSKNSPAIKKKILIYRIALPILWFIIFFSTIIKNPGGGVVLFLIITIPWIVLLPKIFIFTIKRTARKMVLEGKNKNLLTKHTIELTPDEVVEKTESSSYTTGWAAVERVVNNKEFILIYVNSLSAHVIPFRAFKGEEDFTSFYNMAIKFKDSVK